MPDLEFPVECHFRVVAHNQEGMAFVIETVLMELGVTSPVEPANLSAGGKYASFNISTVVESREQMSRIDRELRAIAGVRMVL
jgi:putative lipoic acid-binding regulatory protein